jgi:KDO2-lipid IV(A) lauroyltransferase
MSADERDALTLAHFEALGASLIEMGLGQWASDEELDSLTKIEGIEHLQKAAADGAGVIILSAHFTTLEVVGRVLRIHGPVYDGVYRKNRSPFITAFLLRGREQSARKGIEKTDIKGMVRSLREGVAVWYAADQSYKGKQSALLPFFGVPSMTNTATTTLGKLGRAVAVPFFPRRLEDGTYLLPSPCLSSPGDWKMAPICSPYCHRSRVSPATILSSIPRISRRSSKTMFAGFLSSTSGSTKNSRTARRHCPTFILIWIR